MAKTRAVRLSDQDERKVQRFLRENPLFDFSKLARMAILKFIENPQIEIRGIGLAKDFNVTKVKDGPHTNN